MAQGDVPVSWSELMPGGPGTPPPHPGGEAAWTIEGVVRCPGGCGLYLDFSGTPHDLQEFISKHACAVTGQRMCRAHPDDCPNGPGPHIYYNPQGPAGTWAHCPCCADPGYDQTDENRGPGQ